jgi:D-alanyl-D-alanine carboxypeptidase (penicillin-binding protein 5/6)
MEYNLNDLEDREYLERRAKRKRKMLAKKKKRRRRLIAAMLLMAGIIIVIICGIVGGAKKKAKKEQEEQQAKLQAEMLAQEAAQNVVEEEPVEELPVYEFISNEDTQTIYSENVISSYAILVDESTDIIVASKGAKERINPASMTKVLTLLVAAEHVPEEQRDDLFTMTIDITDYSYVNDCSNVGFLVDEKVPVKDLFYGTILPSGGDAAVGLATYVAGSHEAFVEMMNEKLDELGLSDSAHFTNCVGLYDADHYCSVYDMAIIMKAAMENEFCREVLSTKCYTTTPTTEHPEGIIISNWFLRRIEDKDTAGEVIGAKTGFVAQSGSCAVSYQMSENGKPYICATAGSTSSWRCIYDHVEIYTRYVPGIDEI